MPEDDKEVSEWQAWRKKVDAALSKLAGSGEEDDPEKAESEKAKPEPEPVQPPKKDAEVPKKESEEEPAPVQARGPLHKLIFG